MQEKQPQRDSLSSTAAPNSPPHDPEADPHITQNIPPWVHINDSEDEKLLSPEPVVPNSRHYKPPQPRTSIAEPPRDYNKHYKPGRKWDHLRSAEPPLPSLAIAQNQERWRTFMSAGPNPVERNDAARVVDQAWLDEHMPNLSRPWSPHDYEEADQAGKSEGWWLLSPERQERTVRLFWRLLLKNPFVPLVFRLTVLAFSCAALGISSKIFAAIYAINHDHNPDQCTPRASTYMAIVVDTIAIPYIGYVTWDEYMSKPLGLRSVAAKMVLLLCDLYFIVFFSSNLSLAFDALFDHRWACYNDSLTLETTCPDSPDICYRQRAL